MMKRYTLLVLLLAWQSSSSFAFVPLHQHNTHQASSSSLHNINRPTTTTVTRRSTASEETTQEQAEEWVEHAFQDVVVEAEDVVLLSNGNQRQKLEEDEEESSSAAAVLGPKHVLIYDTTLRDGTQGESVSASVDDKLKIAQRLATFDVDYIEGGWPGSNPKDAAFFERARKLDASVVSKLAAFGSTRRKNVSVKDDPQVAALLECEAPTVCIVAKAHAWQVTDILRADLEENLAMIRDTVAYLTSQGRNVMVDLEHFFDGYRHDADYALQCCRAAADAGATALVLCDTNGGSMPWQVDEICRSVVETMSSTSADGKLKATIGIHCHNDCGMAVANSIVAVQAGVGLVQGTINGIGERTGNADLCSIVPSLALKCDSKMTCRNQLEGITSLSRYVDEILNRTPHHAAPYVGSSAFAHKGGLHVAAMKRSPDSYQHTDPKDVGNESRVLISELSGRQNILGKVQAVMGDQGDGADEVVANKRAMSILKHVKELEAKGYTFEGAEASVHLMILHASQGYCSPFQVLDYSAQVYDTSMDSASRLGKTRDVSGATLGPTARATVKVRTMKPADANEGTWPSSSELPYEERLEVSDGNGPVDALAKALMRALKPSHPYLETVELVDYKVRILDPESATKAATRVMIEFRDTRNDSHQKSTSNGASSTAVPDKTWTTVSVDNNVISASFNALIDGFEYALIEHAESCMLCDEAF